MNYEGYRVQITHVEDRSRLGTYGHLAFFLWFIGMVIFVSSKYILTASIICSLVAAIVYPFSLRIIFRWRWIILMSLLAIPAIFFLGDIDSVFLGLVYSSQGLTAAIQIACRFIVVFIAVEAFTKSVTISAIGGLLERFGMQGLGFSIGVGLNLLPNLQTASMHTWQSLRMRGGLRRKWWRGLKMMAVTILSNAIAQAEEIALAAEARAFSPAKSRPLPIAKGQFDWLVFIFVIISFICIALV